MWIQKVHRKITFALTKGRKKSEWFFQQNNYQSDYPSSYCGNISDSDIFSEKTDNLVFYKGTGAKYQFREHAFAFFSLSNFQNVFKVLKIKLTRHNLQLVGGSQ
jgi:hypothetical protein